MDWVKLYLGDCLQLLPSLPDGSVDAVIADLPYGKTRNHWDTVIPLRPLWRELLRITKPVAAIILFSKQPFTSRLVASQLKLFRYEIIWDKVGPVGYLNANRMPLTLHENILLFYRRLPVYNPQKKPGKPYSRKGYRPQTGSYGYCKRIPTINTGDRFPTSIWVFESASKKANWGHPTEKPLALLEELTLTYTRPGETILDFCMGSGTAGEAAVKHGRRFIGMEKEPDYFAMAERRIPLQPPAPAGAQPGQITLQLGD